MSDTYNPNEIVKVKYLNEFAQQLCSKFDRTLVVVAGKQIPSLTLGAWSKDGTTYSATISYNGDGTLTSTLGTINNGTLSITDADGIFSGVISASEGITYAASKLAFSYNTEEVQAAKTEPTLTLGEWSYVQYQGIQGVQADITYNGDGNLSIKTSKLATIYGSNPKQIFIGAQNNFTGTLYASEGDTYAAKSVEFSRNT